MSAIRDEQVLTSGDGKRSTFSFHQDQAIPSYLFAIAAGDIVKADLGLAKSNQSIVCPAEVSY